MDTKAIRDALELTPDNARQFLGMYKEAWSDKDAVSKAFIDSMEKYDEEVGEPGAFKKLIPLDKLLITYRHAMLKGYLAALQDVYAAQQEGLIIASEAG